MTITNLMMMVLLLGTAYAEWRVINGTTAIMNEFPSLVSIKINGQHFCGGTLIGPNTVLTAGHCVWPVKNFNSQLLRYYNVKVYLGEFDQYSRNGYEREFQVTSSIHHPKFTMDTIATMGYDVGVLKIAGPISKYRYPFIKYANLGNTEISQPGQTCTIAGWGSMMPPGEDTARFLQKADLQILSDNDCSKSFPYVSRTRNNICAGSGGRTTSGCRGDSGGPLFCDHNGSRVQVGIVSYGTVPCGMPHVPGVFTRVSAVSSWIAENTN